MATERQRQIRELEYRLRLRYNKKKEMVETQIIRLRQQVAIITNISIGGIIVILLLLLYIQWLK
jgi:hypothetical protein